MPFEPLHVTLLLLATAVVVIGLFRSLNISSVVGYLVIGILLGPEALGWLPDTPHTRLLAELGVVFLLFTVGLEFSLPVLVTSHHLVLRLGGLQLLVTGAAAGLAAWGVGLTLEAAVVAGGALAMSSTAVVLKQLNEQAELGLRHGRMAVGILLFQDLATLPFLIMVPRLAAGGDLLDPALILALLKAAAAFVLLAVVGRRVVRPAFRWVAGRRSTELFMLAALLTVLGAATLAHAAGLSAPLGAFLAGMVLGETEFRHQIEADILPFREVLLGLFFVTVGMTLDPAILAGELAAVLGIAAALLAAKALIVAGIARATGSGWPPAARAALVLCQGGEFGLLLIAMAADHGLLAPRHGQPLLAALVLSMAVAPMLIRHNQDLARAIVRLFGGGRQRHDEADVAVAAGGMRGHVVIAGYGRTGQTLGRLLQAAGRAYLALDLDPELVGPAVAAGRRVVFGDAARQPILRAAGVEQAAALAVTTGQKSAAIKIIDHARRLNPHLPILVRTREDAELDALFDAGATEVIPEALEVGLIAGGHLLRVLGLAEADIEQQVRRLRSERYRRMRRYFRGGRPSATAEAADRLDTATVPPGGQAAGRPLGEVLEGPEGVEVISVVRGGVHVSDPGPELRLREHDAVVLGGSAGALSDAKARVEAR